MAKLASTLCALLALGLFAVGCGGGDNGDSGNDSAKTTEQPKSGGSGGAAAKAASVTMKDIQFNPKTVAVPAGGTVKWTNDDTVGHDVTASSFKSGPSGGVMNGATYAHKFAKAGTFKYRCTVHPGMEGTVTVK